MIYIVLSYLKFKKMNILALKLNSYRWSETKNLHNNLQWSGDFLFQMDNDLLRLDHRQLSQIQQNLASVVKNTHYIFSEMSRSAADIQSRIESLDKKLVRLQKTSDIYLNNQHYLGKLFEFFSLSFYFKIYHCTNLFWRKYLVILMNFIYYFITFKKQSILYDINAFHDDQWFDIIILSARVGFGEIMFEIYVTKKNCVILQIVPKSKVFCSGLIF